MALKAIVTADHNKKTARLSIVDENGNSPQDFQGQELRNMQFPYDNISQYDFLFDSLGASVNGIEDFHFKVFSFNQD